MPELKKSRSTVCVPMECNGKSLIAAYQTLSGGLVIVDKDDWQSALESPAKVDSGVLGLLLEQGILMRDGINQDHMISHWREHLFHDSGTMQSKVMVTRRCNNRCSYCILGPSEERDMSRGTALAMDHLYLEFIVERGARKIEDQYSGAEPTQNHRIIYESAGRRASFCRGRGIEYGFSIITNGVRLKRSLVERLKQVGLKQIHVSLAGPADIHDSLRPSKLHTGKSYETIMENLQKITGIVPLVIECQYDDQSLDYLRMDEMLDDLANRSIDVRNVVFTPIMRIDDPAGAGAVDGEKFLYLLRLLKQRGYSPLAQAPSNACAADFMSRFVFNTEGAFTPCPALRQPHESRLTYGSVFTGIDFMAHSQLRRELPDRCLHECELFPRVCSGGCRLQALTKTGDFNGVDCQYDMLSMVLNEYIKEQVFSSGLEANLH